MPPRSAPRPGAAAPSACSFQRGRFALPWCHFAGKSTRSGAFTQARAHPVAYCTPFLTCDFQPVSSPNGMPRRPAPILRWLRGLGAVPVTFCAFFLASVHCLVLCGATAFSTRVCRRLSGGGSFSGPASARVRRFRPLLPWLRGVGAVFFGVQKGRRRGWRREWRRGWRRCPLLAFLLSSPRGRGFFLACIPLQVLWHPLM